MPFNNVERAPDLVPARNVLVSTYDKGGLEELLSSLLEAQPSCRFFATGGTLDALRALLGPSASAQLVSVSEYSGQTEMAGGLVKTLDWKLYLGLLAEPGNPGHAADLERLGAVAFDMVIVNLYPFAAASARPDATPEDLRQHIDIGGPALLRAAAKNFLRVASVSSPGQYPGLIGEIRSSGGTSLLTRRGLAAATFAAISRYDEAIATKLASIDPARLVSAYRGQTP